MLYDYYSNYLEIVFTQKQLSNTFNAISLTHLMFLRQTLPPFLLERTLGHLGHCPRGGLQHLRVFLQAPILPLVVAIDADPVVPAQGFEVDTLEHFEVDSLFRG